MASLRRYSQLIDIVAGRQSRDQVQPPLTKEEEKTLEGMIRDDKEYFEQTGKHLIFEVPFGVFDEDYNENRKLAQTIYTESVEEYATRKGLNRRKTK